MQLHQVAQRATDLDRSIAFYRDVVGLPFIARFDPPGLAFFDLDGVRLLLEGSAPGATLYLRVDDIEAAVNELAARGVSFTTGIELVHRDDAGAFGEPGAEERMAFFEDPDGNVLALANRRSPA
jgi:methylmalonyl-CoA/ethylmalonyl-CoA epimerase